MSSTSEFGKEIGLVHQIIMNAKRLGADERFWKSLVNNDEFLTSVIDFSTFHHGPRIGLCVAGPVVKDFSLLCFSQNIWVNHEEVVARVERFGRFATDSELELICNKFQELHDVSDLPPLQYPIVACADEEIARHPDYFLAITYGAGCESSCSLGRPGLTKCDTWKQLKSGLTWSSATWAPGTWFAALSRATPVKNVLDSRKR